MWRRKEKKPESGASGEAKKPSEPTLSAEEIQHLEETKHKLFPGFLKKTKVASKIEALQGQFEPAAASLPPKSQPPLIPVKPTPPKKPQRPDMKPPVIPPSAPDRNGHGISVAIADRHGSGDSGGVLSSPVGEAAGFHSDSLKNFSLPGLNLPVLKRNLQSERMVTVQRHPGSGDFGFSIRRAQFIERNPDFSEKRQVVIFAEPISIGAHNKTGLLPGDQLLEVNGTNVANMVKDQIIALIKSSGDRVALKVRPVPELAELASRLTSDGSAAMTESLEITEGPGDLQLRLPSFVRSGSKRYDKSQYVGTLSLADSVDAPAEKLRDRVWLSHRGGFTAAQVVGPGSGEGKVKIQLEGGGEPLEVDADDLDKANPPGMDKVEDLRELIFLNECSALHVLRQRFGSNLIHTYGGSFSTLIINPMTPLTIYSEKIVQMFKGCKRADMPPHIYAVAQQVYRAMQSSRRNQSVVFTGRSGSGKTVQMRHLLQYLCLVAGSVNKAVTIEKLNAAMTLLEAFGNCRTYMNVNASRYCTMMTLEFDHLGQISSAVVQAMLLELSRVTNRPVEESNFNIFYFLWEGADQELRKELHMDTLNEGNPLFDPLEAPTDREVASSGWKRVLNALQFLSVNQAEAKVVWSVLAAIVHLSAAGATKGIPSFKSQFIKGIHAQRAASLLGVPFEDLSKTIFACHQQQVQLQQERKISDSNKRSNVKRQSSSGEKIGFRASLDKSSITDRTGDGVEALNAFITGLYRELFSLVVSLVNRSLCSNNRTLNSITLVDAPGFQNPGTVRNSPRKAANFDEFCFNYAQERLFGVFYESNFTKQMEMYQHENVNVEFEGPSLSPLPLIALLDKPSQQTMIRSNNIELRSQEKRGLMWLLDEESIFPGASDESFLERMFVHYGDMKEGLLRKSKQHYNHFVLKHALGTNPVIYNAAGWLKVVQENPITRSVLSLLQESQKDAVSSLFLTLRGIIVPGLAASGDSAAIRRHTAIYKTVGSLVNLKRRSQCSMVKVQMDCIVETLNRTSRVHFVNCLLPQHEAGVGGQRVSDSSAGQSDEAVINVPLLRSQLRGLQLLEAVRLDKIGFPEKMLFGDFKRRFECLAPPDYKPTSALLDDRQSVEHLLKAIDIDRVSYQMGLSQIFLRSELLSHLEDLRDEKLSVLVIKLQAHCRSYLARKQLEKRRIQRIAIQCVQKNILKHMAVKSWPWWKLYTRVLPLLNVNRTEDELKSRLEELELIKEKYLKLEVSYAELRTYCDRLEARMAETKSELTEERGQTSQTTDLLEQENIQRVRAEQQYNEIKSRYAALEKQTMKLESEVMEYRTLKSVISEDSDSDENVTKEKYEKTKKQFDAKVKQLESDKKTEVEQLQGAKKQLERKVADAMKEAEENKQQAAANKQKAQRVTEQMQDISLHAEKLETKNNELEKKQKRFDHELNAVREVADAERAQKERFLREKEESFAKIFSLEQKVTRLEDELNSAELERSQLKRQVDDLGSSTGTSDTEVILLKRGRQELELKCKDLEEELDEMAGDLQKATQAITKFEMQMERLKADQLREIEAKDAEMTDLRAQTQRRIKTYEDQLEEEFVMKQNLVREKRDLEERMRDMADLPVDRDRATEANLRRHLKRREALLRDAQTLLEHHKDSAPSKGAIKQLKNQLEDSECARLNLLKSKQNVTAELDELRQQLDQALKTKSDTEELCIQLRKEKNDLISQLIAHEDDCDQHMKRFKALVQEVSEDRKVMMDHLDQIAELVKENEELKEQLGTMSSKFAYAEAHMVDKHKLALSETKCKDWQSKLDCEESEKLRYQSQVGTLRESVANLQREILDLKSSLDKEQELSKRLSRQISAVQDTLAETQKREAEMALKKADLENALDRAEQDHEATHTDLKLAIRRIDELQAALREDDDDDTSMRAGQYSDLEEDDDGEFDRSSLIEPIAEELLNPVATGATD